MTHTEFFEAMNAPLKVVRTSWGAVRSKDGAIFLRAWNDQVRIDADGQKWVQIGYPNGSGAGWTERQTHVQAIEDGAKCLLVMCEAVDEFVSPRTINTFDQRTVIVGGEIEREDGSAWIRAVESKSIWDVRDLSN
jgi:hypothetical protein